MHENLYARNATRSADATGIAPVSLRICRGNTHASLRPCGVQMRAEILGIAAEAQRPVSFVPLAGIA